MTAPAYKRPTWLVYITITGSLRSSVEVEADYFKIEGGNVIFRNAVRGSYPDVVRVFAAGHWHEIVGTK